MSLKEHPQNIYMHKYKPAYTTQKTTNKYNKQLITINTTLQDNTTDS